MNNNKKEARFSDNSTLYCLPNSSAVCRVGWDWYPDYWKHTYNENNSSHDFFGAIENVSLKQTDDRKKANQRHKVFP